MITAADVKLLRNKVSKAIDTLEPQLVISDEDHTVAREIIAELPTVFDNMCEGTLPSAEHIARVALATCKDIQFRDYLMGLFTEFDSHLIGAYLEIINNSVKAEYAYPATTILSSYYFREGNKEAAVSALAEILEFKPQYPLANLLSRIYPIADTDMFVRMAGELHPQVKEKLND